MAIANIDRWNLLTPSFRFDIINLHFVANRYILKLFSYAHRYPITAPIRPAKRHRSARALLSPVDSQDLCPPHRNNPVQLTRLPVSAADHCHKTVLLMAYPRGTFAAHPCDTLNRWQTNWHGTWENSKVARHNAGTACARPIRFDPPWAPPHNVVRPARVDRTHSRPTWAASVGGLRQSRLPFLLQLLRKKTKLLIHCISHFSVLKVSKIFSVSKQQ